MISETTQRYVAQEGRTALVEEGLVAKWNSKEKIKTAAGALVICLNVGVDPPGLIRISPCPTKHAWVDPVAAPIQRALETIGKNLQTQYERWQPRAKYRLALDPTVDQVRRVCMNLRRSARGERVLFHYNGHGVPKPTGNGEIWVFNSHFTQYIPLSVYDLQTWLGNPVIYVLDCASAGTIIDAVLTFMAQATREVGVSAGMLPFVVQDRDPMKGIIMMGSCRAGENLDTHPDYPADLFTSCLTTPVKVALRWLLGRSLVKGSKVTTDLLDSIPGLPQERKSPLGELHWIFTAVTDSIAWDVLPSHLFQKLFRHDLLVASLFRNFLLAERVMSSMGVMPVSYPRLPPSYHHHLWQTWDVAAERILMQLPDMLLNKPPREFRFTSFFSEQLDAFALSLRFGSSKKAPPQQLPVLLQVLLSPVHRVRALELLYEFLELGTWAVELSLSVGVFPYVLKLLQTTAVDLQRTLICIWAKLVALDSSCQADLCKDNGHEYFIHFLEKDGGELDLKAKAAAVLSFICHKYPQGQKLCLDAQLLSVCAKLLSQPGVDSGSSAQCEMQKWICLCIASLCECRPEAVAMVSRNQLPELVMELISAACPDLRAAAVAAMTSFVLPGHTDAELQQFDLLLFEHLSSASSKLIYDGSPVVRAEVGHLLNRLVQKPPHAHAFDSAMMQVQRDVDVQSNGLQRHALPVTTTVQKVGHLLNLQSDKASPQRDDILRWTTHDASEAQLQSLPLDDRSSHDAMGHPADCHRRILDNLCALAVDPVYDVAQSALEAFHGLHWDLEFWPQPESAKRTKQQHSLTESEIQGPLLGRAASMIRIKSKSRASHDSQGGHTSAALSTSSGSAEQPDFQEQAQILQTRIELASKYCQRRPFKIKRLPRSSRLSQGGLPVPREPYNYTARIPGFGAVVESSLTRISSSSQGSVDRAPFQTTVIAHLARTELANPHSSSNKPFSGVPRVPNREEQRGNAEEVDIKGMTLSRHVRNIRTSAENIGSLLLDAARPLIAVADREGHIFIHDYSKPAHPEVSSFALSGLQQSSVPDSVDTVALFCLEESQSLDKIMACSADGSVRVWERCTDREACSLLSAWQAVPVSAPPAFVLAPACFDWQASSGHLFSAGLSLPGIVRQTDLEREQLIQQFAIDKHSRPAIDFLKCFRQSPQLLSIGSADGMVRVFDCRSNCFICGTRPFSTQGPISAMTPVHTPYGESLCVLSYGGTLKHLKISQSNTSVVSSLLPTPSIKAHSSGCTSALISHWTHPIMASATLHPVIKVWSGEGDCVSAIRPFRKYRENCQQAVTSMAFHPVEWRRFAAGGKGRVCGIYDLTQKPE